MVNFTHQVKTETHKQEQAAGRKLFGGIMSRSGINMISSIVMNSIRTGTSFKDTANTSLLWFNNTLMALMEASPPIELVSDVAAIPQRRFDLLLYPLPHQYN